MSIDFDWGSRQDLRQEMQKIWLQLAASTRWIWCVKDSAKITYKVAQRGQVSRNRSNRARLLGRHRTSAELEHAGTSTCLHSCNILPREQAVSCSIDNIDMKSYLVHNTNKSSPDHKESIWPCLRVRIYTGLRQNIHEGRCSIYKYLGILRLMVERINPLLHSKSSFVNTKKRRRWSWEERRKVVTVTSSALTPHYALSSDRYNFSLKPLGSTITQTTC